MGSRLVWPIARTQLRLLVRDRRLAWLAAILVTAMMVSMVAGEARNRRLAAERQAAAIEAEAIWAGQGPTNPHGAAHFGKDVFAPVSPLAALDPGLLDHLGVSVRLEGHGQNPARERPAEGGAALSSFSGFSAAWALRIVGPLLIVLAGFSVFAGDRGKQALTQELAAGASRTALVAGHMVALGAIALGLAAVFTAVGLVILAFGQAGGSDPLAVLLMGAACFLYLLIFVGLTLTASAVFRSARGALVSLLCFWALSSLVMPRLAPAVAEQLHPTPTAPAFERAVTEEVRDGVSGHDPSDERLERFRDDTLRRYGVTRVEDLPVNFAGLALQFGERNATDTYNRHYARLFGAYEAQAGVQRRLAFLSPALALAPLSMGLARTDGDAHLAFLLQAEAYRYTLIQTLNAAVVQHRPQGNEPFLTEIGPLTDHLVFVPQPRSLMDTLRRHASDALALLAWALAAMTLALVGARRLEPTP